MGYAYSLRGSSWVDEYTEKLAGNFKVNNTVLKCCNILQKVPSMDGYWLA